MAVKVLLVGGTGRKVGCLLGGLTLLGIGEKPDAGIYYDVEPPDENTRSEWDILRFVGFDNRRIIPDGGQMREFLRNNHIDDDVTAFLFSDRELDQSINDGFHALPKLAATCFDLAKPAPPWHPPIGENDSVYILFSCFGGTGAGIGPRMVDQVLDYIKDRNVTLTVMVYTPYLNVPGRNPEVVDNSTRTVLSYLDRKLNEVRRSEARCNFCIIALGSEHRHDAEELVAEESLLLGAKLIAEDVPGQLIGNARRSLRPEAGNHVCLMAGISSPQNELFLTPRAAGQPSGLLIGIDTLVDYVHNSRLLLDNLCNRAASWFAPNGQITTLEEITLLRSLAVHNGFAGSLAISYVAVDYLFRYLDRLGHHAPQEGKVHVAYRAKPPKNSAFSALSNLCWQSFHKQLKTRAVQQAGECNRRCWNEAFVAAAARVTHVFEPFQGTHLQETSIVPGDMEIMNEDFWLSSTPDPLAVPRKFKQLFDQNNVSVRGHSELLFQSLKHGINLDEKRACLNEATFYIFKETGKFICAGIMLEDVFTLFVPFWREIGGRLEFRFQKNIPEASYRQIPGENDVTLADGNLQWNSSKQRWFNYANSLLKQDPSLQGFYLVFRPGSDGKHDIFYKSSRDVTQKFKGHTQGIIKSARFTLNNQFNPERDFSFEVRPDDGGPVRMFIEISELSNHYPASGFTWKTNS